ncbi:hypothetical protein HPP92_008505 [Vanilla planifolia]|uniref:Uncharacterized protein n=1 Tax=Vanilla planifolia TaxID=51239 RepID=A0A835R6G5_VANPL|nr:hypothetical protein HPP92_008505 [Vanilla planifolia]
MICPAEPSNGCGYLYRQNRIADGTQGQQRRRRRRITKSFSSLSLSLSRASIDQFLCSILGVSKQRIEKRRILISFFAFGVFQSGFGRCAFPRG